MNEYLEQAISEVNNLNEGEEFLVRDLFKAIWLLLLIH